MERDFSVIMPFASIFSFNSKFEGESLRNYVRDHDWLHTGNIKCRAHVASQAAFTFLNWLQNAGQLH